MQDTTSHKSPSRRLGTAFAVLLCGLLSLVTMGCGSSSSDDGIIGGPYPVNSGGFRVQISEEALGLLFPQPNTDPEQVNAAIERFTLYVYQGNTLVATRSTAYVDGDLDLTVSDLPITQYNLVLAGRDVDGDLVNDAARTNLAFPLAGGLQLLTGVNFYSYPGFIIPADNQAP